MKLLVFADTHNSSRRMLEVAMQHRDADACIHLGDGMADADVLPTLFPPSSIYRVQGNCDIDSSDFEQRLLPFGGLRFFMTHGHLHGVKYGLDQLWHTAKMHKADVALFGHTHQPWYELKNGIHLFNPGSLTMPRGQLGPSYGIITLSAEGDAPQFDILKYERK